MPWKYIPTNPKLKAVQSGGRWPQHRKKVKPVKVRHTVDKKFLSRPR